MKKSSLFSLMLLAPILVQAQTKELSGYSVNLESKCADYSKVNLSTPEGSCVGLVASKEDGLKRPRRIIQLDDGDFLITDMYGWVANRGIVWRYSPKTKSLSKVFTGVDHAHGLALAPDGLVYVGERSKIFRFDPNNPEDSKEYVITNLPEEGSHPLTHFVFDDKGDIYVNVGAPSDQCLDDDKKAIYPCVYEDEAAIRKYTRNSENQFDANFKVVAQGLRNSMGLAIHPETGDLYQAENNMDFDLEDGPKEEINLVIEGKHYGWPYCYENDKLNPKYKRTFFNRRIPKIDCSAYEAPVETLPSHSAPLDMLFYQGEMFLEFQGKLIVSLHGYRETGHRIVTMDLNKADSYKEIVNNWAALSGKNPKGAPVGLTVAKDGSIWFVEDKNKTIMVLSKGEQSLTNQDQDGGAHLTHTLTPEAISSFSKLRKEFLNNRCQSCHTTFLESDELTIKKFISDGWIIPGKSENSPLYQRVTGSELDRQMPPSGVKLTPSEVEQIQAFINSL